MKKIIKNRVYDTNTAKEIGCYSNDMSGFDIVEEALYIKKTGEYFLHGHGGARTKYAKCDDYGSSSSGDRIIPMTYDEAREWAQERLDADKYISIFGDPEEESGTEIISISLPKAMAARIRREAQQEGITISGYISNHLG